MELDDLKELMGKLSMEEIGLIFGKSWLSDRAILRHMEQGNIVIDPFNRENLQTDSYDVALGEWFWREQVPEDGITIYNPYSEKDVRKVWGEKPHFAKSARLWTSKYGELENIDSDERIFFIDPGETMLCHTQEFIGGRGGIVTTMMKARSTVGRNFIEVCKCAGKGDVGFANRWTMEFTNNSRYYREPLVVGRRYAQILFFEVEKIIDIVSDYTKSGKYQTSSNMTEVKANWSPHDMLPKMYKDREVRKLL